MFKNAVVGGPWGELGVSECNGQKWNAGTDTEDADARSSLELELQSIRNLLSGLCSSGGCVGGLRGVDVIRRGRAPVRMRLPAFSPVSFLVAMPGAVLAVISPLRACVSTRKEQIQLDHIDHTISTGPS